MRFNTRSAAGSALALVLLCGQLAGANLDQPIQFAPQDNVLSLRAGVASTAALPNLLDQGRFIRGRHYVLQLDGPMTPARRDALSQAGVALGQYLPTNAFTVSLDGADLDALRALGFVTWVGDFENSWKIDPELGWRAHATQERQALAAAGREALTIHLFANEPIAPAQRAIAKLGGIQVLGTELVGRTRTLTINAPLQAVGALAAINAVQFVEIAPEFTVRNNSNRWIVQSNISGVTPLYDNGLHGEGQILGLIDTKVAVNHCAFDDPDNPIGENHRKIVAYNATISSPGYHGTHVASIATGDNHAFDSNRGIAYLARFVYNTIPIMNESTMLARFNLHRSQNAFIHTNSWGNDGTTAYDGASRAIDSFSYDNDDQLVIFAVTNTDSLKNPENSKNVLAVGATRDASSQGSHCFGGRGPTNDGRRKPEIYAPGCGTYAAKSDTSCGVRTLSGTSMAAPAVAATALLTRQYFTDGFYPTGTAQPGDAFTPSGALLKATLINSAVDMTGVLGYPSTTEGWGRVLADNALYFAGDARGMFVEDVRNNSGGALSTNGQADFDIEVDSADEILRLTLAWHDAPASAFSGFTPVNNLDMVVTAPDGTTYFGNVFEGGTSVPDGTPDEINNLEQVHIAAPQAGIWTVTVVGAAVNIGSQGYGLVVSGDLAGTCAADFNGDGIVNTLDFLAYLNAYSAGDLSADFNGDGVINTQDFIAFLNAFNVGC